MEQNNRKKAILSPKAKRAVEYINQNFRQNISLRERSWPRKDAQMQFLPVVKTSHWHDFHAIFERAETERGQKAPFELG